MTRKDYQLIAGTIAPIVKGARYDHRYESCLRELVNTLSDKLEQDNPRFNRETFWRACALDQSWKLAPSYELARCSLLELIQGTINKEEQE